MNWLFDTIARLFGQVMFWVTVQPWEQAIRVRLGRHVRRLAPDMHWRIPIIDQVHKQSSAWRTALITTQTLSTMDSATVITAGTVGYVISDIEKLYRSLHHAEDTVVQIAAAAIADAVQCVNKADVTKALISERATEAIRDRLTTFGLGEIELRLTDFAFVRAFRLVQDQRWAHGGALRTESTPP